jgi:opacity protein-like surface antigen
MRALFSALAASVTLFAAAAQAEPSSQPYLTGYVGAFDLVQGDDEAVQFGVEYRFAPWDYGLRPVIGFNATDDGSMYGYGGLNWDIEVFDNLYIIPNFMAGLYEDGDGKDLGGMIEFRSGVEVAYEFENDHRLGVAFNHISNASIYDHNPGSETLLVNYSIPLSW